MRLASPVTISAVTRQRVACMPRTLWTKPFPFPSQAKHKALPKKHPFPRALPGTCGCIPGAAGRRGARRGCPAAGLGAGAGRQGGRQGRRRSRARCSSLSAVTGAARGRAGMEVAREGVGSLLRWVRGHPAPSPCPGRGCPRLEPLVGPSGAGQRARCGGSRGRAGRGLTPMDAVQPCEPRWSCAEGSAAGSPAMQPEPPELRWPLGTRGCAWEPREGLGLGDSVSTSPVMLLPSQPRPSGHSSVGHQLPAALVPGHRLCLSSRTALPSGWTLRLLTGFRPCPVLLCFDLFGFGGFLLPLSLPRCYCRCPLPANPNLKINPCSRASCATLIFLRLKTIAPHS